jgi:transposase
MGKKLTHEEFRAKVIEKNEHVRNGEIEIRGEFINTSNRIECYCNKHDVLWNPIADSLYKNIGCRECAKEGISRKNSMTHEEYVAGMRVRNSAIKVLTEYNGMDKDITVELECGHVWTTKAAYVYYRDFGCPYCSGNAILVGFNDLWTTAPQVSKLLTNPEDGYSISKYSGQKKNFTCPLCGKVQEKIIKNITRRGFQCSYCGDGISYPNKFGRAFLDQVVGDNYIPEYICEWCKPYKYDNYFCYNNKSYFLEMDGGFHYLENNMSEMSLEERQNVDRIKEQLARDHNICLIRIDCLESDSNYIANSILSSELNMLFDLSKIDWQKCNIKAQKNLVKEACGLYMSGIKSTDEISKIIKVGRSTATRYLKTGAELGWCDYDPKKAHKGLPNKKRRQPILATNIESGKEYYFDGVCICEKTIFDICGIKVNRKSIRDASNSVNPYKGFIFNYIDKTVQN